MKDTNKADEVKSTKLVRNKKNKGPKGVKQVVKHEPVSKLSGVKIELQDNKKESEEKADELLEAEEKKESVKSSKPKKKGPNIALIKKIAMQKQMEDEEAKKIQKENEEFEKKRKEAIEEARRIQIEREKEEKKQLATETKLKKLRIRNFTVREKVKSIPDTEDTVHIPEESASTLKSPICCILGHVDTGKTKLLDKIRETNVQGGEAGGITQQIGATFFPISELRKKCKIEKSGLPGILVIDTPGHETFSNLRSRGSSLCDIAILVVDILHLLENQTLESIEMLRKGRTPFVIALNKIDRIYGWNSEPYGFFSESLKKQSQTTVNEFHRQMEDTVLRFAEIGLNARLFTENKNDKEFISIIPTSAITGEGIPDLIRTILKFTESYMSRKITFTEETSATILEVKEVEGYGSTIDVILSNGVLKKGDKIAVCGFDGPIITTIRSLLVPKAMKEIRVKGEYSQVKEVKASLGVKISALNLETAVAGSRILLVNGNEEEMKIAVMEDLKNILVSVKTQEVGIRLQSSTLGSLEALIEFTSKSNIPISSIGVGKLRKKDIIKSSIVRNKSVELSPILCFDIKIDKEILDLAEQYKVKIFCEKIVYNLLDKYKEYAIQLKQKQKQTHKASTYFPCQLSILPNCVFNKRSPLIIGVEVERGTLKIGTPLCVVNKGTVNLGKVTSIENNTKPVEKANKGEKVALKIEIGQGESPRVFGRHFQAEDKIYSHISRASIDNLKSYYKDELEDDDWLLVIDLKNKLDII